MKMNDSTTVVPFFATVQKLNQMVVILQIYIERKFPNRKMGPTLFYLIQFFQGFASEMIIEREAYICHL